MSKEIFGPYQERELKSAINILRKSGYSDMRTKILASGLVEVECAKVSASKVASEVSKLTRKAGEIVKQFVNGSYVDCVIVGLEPSKNGGRYTITDKDGSNHRSVSPELIS
jgi:hypothetical protein